jgi:hypothetical protein
MAATRACPTITTTVMQPQKAKPRSESFGEEAWRAREGGLAGGRKEAERVKTEEPEENGPAQRCGHSWSMG